MFLKLTVIKPKAIIVPDKNDGISGYFWGDSSHFETEVLGYYEIFI